MRRGLSGHRGGPGWEAVVVAAAALVLAGATPPAAAGTLRVEVGEGLVAALGGDGALYLEAAPRPGEGLLSLCRRLSGGEEAADAIAAANGGARRLLAGVRYRVPFAVLRPHYQLQVVRALFREDRAAHDGWHHKVSGAPPPAPATLWHISRWFTGDGQNFRAIREHNGLQDNDLVPGQSVAIPTELLLPALRAALPPDPAYRLEYTRDATGDFAVYRLRPGEALYSSVVVRFTGRVFAADVNALAEEIARGSGIADVTDIPVGYEVKIPFDLLLPEFLPPGHPRRLEYEEARLASGRFSNQVTARQLEGITVILDAGHGGKDVGASMAGVWESLYVYDITVRVKRWLEERTAAQVLTTTRDGDDFRVPERDILAFSRDHRVLTDPAYEIEDSTVGVHLRWYLANSMLRRAVGSGGDPGKVVFLSIHADSLHPALRGGMAYIPGADGRGGSYGKAGAIYASRREFREQPRVSFSHRELVKSEGLSRQLAGHLIESFVQEGLGVHPFKPVREKIIRNRRAWVPAVLRYNEVPAKVLLEVCNLSNGEDRELIQTRSYREKVAAAIGRGILAYYGVGPEAGGLQVATAAP